MNFTTHNATDYDIDEIMKEAVGKHSVCVHKLIDIERACRRSAGYLKRIGLPKAEWKHVTVCHRMARSRSGRSKKITATRITLKLVGRGCRIIDVQKVLSEPKQAEVLEIFVPERKLTPEMYSQLEENHIAVKPSQSRSM